MIQKKVCMLGSFAVGKTSLVRRFVSNQFSDKYMTTVGVKIESHVTQVEDRFVKLILWDLHGNDEFQRVRLSYLRGASACLLVADGTRAHTLDQALALRSTTEGILGPVPFLLAVNKGDLRESFELDANTIRGAVEPGMDWMETSAKTGAGVQDAFQLLAERMLA